MSKRFRWGTGLVALAIIVSWGLPAAADSTKQKTSLRWFADGEKVEDTTARLRRNDDGVGFRIKTRELTPGDAITVWVVTFNHPSECSGDCGEDDLGSDDVGITVAFGAGGLVGDDGRARFEGFLQRHDTSGALRIPGFLQDPPAGLGDPDEAEVHLVVRSHGPALEDQVYEQTHTFGGGCAGPIPPGTGDPGPNECEDQQFAVFEAPDEDDD